MTPEWIAELRTRYAMLESMWAAAPTWDKSAMMKSVEEACNAAKTIPSLLDEIERLQAELDTRP